MSNFSAVSPITLEQLELLLDAYLAASNSWMGLSRYPLESSPPLDRQESLVWPLVGLSRPLPPLTRLNRLHREAFFKALQANALVRADTYDAKTHAGYTR